MSGPFPPPPRSRRRPGIIHRSTTNDFNWLAKEQLEAAVAYAAERYARGRLLDVGCGAKPYRELLAPYVTEHVGVDHAGSPHSRGAVDVTATAYDIPLSGESFDTVLMTEVLEHLESPHKALREAHRLLVAGGVLILTTPFIWAIHEEPRDFFRYSPYGLRYLLRQAGFEEPEVRPLAGQWSTWALITSYALRQSELRWRVGDPARVLARAVQRAGAWLDRRNYRPWLAYNHLAVARKPAGDQPAGESGEVAGAGEG